MPVIQFKKEFTMNDILGVVEQFDNSELEEFIQKNHVLKKKKATKTNASKEAALIAIIQRNFTKKEQSRFNDLVKKRQQYIITDTELIELIEMTNYSEQITVERIKALAALSKLTGKDIDVLMHELNIKPYSNA